MTLEPLILGEEMPRRSVVLPPWRSPCLLTKAGPSPQNSAIGEDGGLCFARTKKAVVMRPDAAPTEAPALTDVIWRRAK
ncbi:hypothetical protein [Bradyrhizobium sp. NP1]|uniref:hypothetical protein n=1 Tax=Bradyrhizobium sp. NP1 TaxID=3049772 RepID=UPI0025A5B377|nr:hypothetical protein [Bradyrhizobium sp. NP1]WJR79715.1 hypothetical protein QOU61_08075 [Bradyrhizobium sp. NP1]